MSRTYCLKIMIKRDKLIVFLGSVGIGKSTVIKGLAYVLKARGFRTYRIFIKAFHGSAYRPKKVGLIYNPVREMFFKLEDERIQGGLVDCDRCKLRL